MPRSAARLQHKASHAHACLCCGMPCRAGHSWCARCLAARCPPQCARRHPIARRPNRQVVLQTYEYHGLNSLAMFCVTALAVTLVLYWHWGVTTATFKATVQRSFQTYGNPDWQSQSMGAVDTMFDAVEYSVGWLEFWLDRADMLGAHSGGMAGWPGSCSRQRRSELPPCVRRGPAGEVRAGKASLAHSTLPACLPAAPCHLLLLPARLPSDWPREQEWPGDIVRVGEYADVLYARLLVNIDRNCDPLMQPWMGCYATSDLTKQLQADELGGGRPYDNLLQWAGWSNVGKLKNRDSTYAGRDGTWWAYPLIAAK